MIAKKGSDNLVIYESKVLKVKVDKGILSVEEGGRTLNIDLKIYVEPFQQENQQER